MEHVLAKLDKGKRNLESILDISAFPIVENSTYQLLKSAVGQHHKIVKLEQKRTINTNQEIANDSRLTLGEQIYDQLTSGRLSLDSKEGFMELIRPYATAKLREEQITDLLAFAEATEQEIEEQHTGYIIVLGFDKNNPKHLSSVDKEIYNGTDREAEVNVEKRIKGSITQPEIRDALLELAYRDGAMLFDRKGEFLDGRMLLQGIKTSEIPTIYERFQNLALPSETKKLTEHGLDPVAGTRNQNSLAFTNSNPETVVYTLSATGIFTIRRYQKGVLTLSTRDDEQAVASTIVKANKNYFLN